MMCDSSVYLLSQCPSFTSNHTITTIKRPKSKMSEGKKASLPRQTHKRLFENHHKFSVCTLMLLAVRKIGGQLLNSFSLRWADCLSFTPSLVMKSQCVRNQRCLFLFWFSCSKHIKPIAQLFTWPGLEACWVCISVGKRLIRHTFLPESFYCWSARHRAEGIFWYSSQLPQKSSLFSCQSGQRSDSASTPRPQSWYGLSVTLKDPTDDTDTRVLVFCCTAFPV